MREPFRVSRGCLCEKKGALTAIAAGRRGTASVTHRKQVGQGPPYAIHLTPAAPRKSPTGVGRAQARLTGYEVHRLVSHERDVQEDR